MESVFMKLIRDAEVSSVLIWKETLLPTRVVINNSLPVQPMAQIV